MVSVWIIMIAIHMIRMGLAKKTQLINRFILPRVSVIILGKWEEIAKIDLRKFMPCMVSRQFAKASIDLTEILLKVKKKKSCSQARASV